MTSGRMASITLGLALVVTAVAMPMEGSPPATGLQPPAEIPVSNPPAGSPDEAPVADPDFVIDYEGVAPAGDYPPAGGYPPEGDNQPAGGESPEGESSPAGDYSNFDDIISEDDFEYGEFTPEESVISVDCELRQLCEEFGINHETLGKKKIPFSNFVLHTSDTIPKNFNDSPAWMKSEWKPTHAEEDVFEQQCIQAMENCME